jgi:hypothetical protein
VAEPHPGGVAAELGGLREELEQVVRDTAELLLRSGHDAAKLLDLDERVRELNARIRTVALRERVQAPKPRPPPPARGGGTLSGG